MFLPSMKKLKEQRHGKKELTIDKGDDNSAQVMKTSKLTVNIDSKHSNAVETEKGRQFELMGKSTCLGSTIIFLMDDMVDARQTTMKTTKSMFVLKIRQDAREVHLSSKIKLHEAIPLNLLLLGSEN